MTYFDCNSGSSPLRNSAPLPTTVVPFSSLSWSGRLLRFRQNVEEFRKRCDFDGWSREIWILGSWWLEVSGSESAGIVCDLVKEFKSEQSKSKRQVMIPRLSGNIFIDFLEAKCLVIEVDVSIQSYWFACVDVIREI
jgi:hypothetical protein